MRAPSMLSRLVAELFGTFWLVFGGCGSAIFAATQIGKDGNGRRFEVGIGYLGVSLAFGLTVLTMVYAVGRISGGHFNPAVSFGAAIAGRLAWKDVLPYWVVQIIGGLLAGLALFGIASGRDGFDRVGNMAANGFGDHSPDGYSMVAVLIAEILLTAFFVLIILGATHDLAPKNFAGIAIGLTLTLIHLISIPISNTSVNPARSIGVAFFNGNGAPAQLWLFIVAPLIGAAIAAVVYQAVFDAYDDETVSVDAVSPDYLEGK